MIPIEKKKNVLAVIGSASKNSSNLHLVNKIGEWAKDIFTLTIFNCLADLPHFNPELAINNTPNEVLAFREMIQNADGILICTPAYIFSIPSGLKNAIEWCVSTTVFSNKPIGLITASAHGEKAQEELLLIMRTLNTKFTDSTTLLIPGIKGKINSEGNLTNAKTEEDLKIFIANFYNLLQE